MNISTSQKKKKTHTHTHTQIHEILQFFVLVKKKKKD